jgi:site-specific DNA-methyltransferase (adenine-specific)
MSGLPRNEILVGDARSRLTKLPAASVDCIITSPPFFRLRDYQTEGQLGLEDSVAEWVEGLRSVLLEVMRVLKPTGSVWLNLGDSYSRHDRFGAPSKSLLLGPERLALALISDGWTIRNKLVWAKTNNMPSSVGDRLTCKWEVFYFLVRSRHYFFDLDAIRRPLRSTTRAVRGTAEPIAGPKPDWAGPLAGNNSGLARMKRQGRTGHPLGGNPGDVITTAAASFHGPHFATFPEPLIEQPLLAGCPERVCHRCGAPWSRDLVDRSTRRPTLGQLRPSCRCRAGWQPGLVLDPFMGAGTVGLVAERHHRDWLGIELNSDFAALARQRIDHERQVRNLQKERHRAA